MPTFSLRGPVRRFAPAEIDDVIDLKSALIRTGDYARPANGLSAAVDDEMSRGLMRFQYRNGLKVDGAATPGGPTERTLDRALAQPTDPHPTNAPSDPRRNTQNGFETRRADGKAQTGLFARTPLRTKPPGQTLTEKREGLPLRQRALISPPRADQRGAAPGLVFLGDDPTPPRPLRLGGGVGEQAENAPEDMVRAKHALAWAGYYPMARDKIADPTPETEFRHAILDLQAINGLRRDGRAQPGGETEAKLNELNEPGFSLRTRRPATDAQAKLPTDWRRQIDTARADTVRVASIEPNFAGESSDSLAARLNSGADGTRAGFGQAAPIPTAQTQTARPRIAQSPLPEPAAPGSQSGPAARDPAPPWAAPSAMSEPAPAEPAAPDPAPPAFVPSLDTLRRIAPETDWTEERVAAQQSVIGQSTAEANTTALPEFQSRVPGAAGVSEYYAFDGKQMMHVRDGQVIRSWPAVSGREGFQTRAHQHEENKGPIPEGSYSLRQDRHQAFQDIPAHFRMLDHLPFYVPIGPWPGSTESWGENRVWVSGPNGEERPVVQGRSGFAVHGGAAAGSQGCIDLTEHMPDFTAYFKNQNRDLPLIVSYPEVK